jgi:hypothetical protein
LLSWWPQLALPWPESGYQMLFKPSSLPQTHHRTTKWSNRNVINAAK